MEKHMVAYVVQTPAVYGNRKPIVLSIGSWILSIGSWNQFTLAYFFFKIHGRSYIFVPSLQRLAREMVSSGFTIKMYAFLCPVHIATVDGRQSEHTFMLLPGFERYTS
jgi:hypothetical protein